MTTFFIAYLQLRDKGVNFAGNKIRALLTFYLCFNMNSEYKSFSVLCESAFGEVPSGCVQLPGAGGDRRYYRLALSDRSVLGVVADRKEEARAFIDLSRVFAGNAVNVPEVFAWSEDYAYYILEDLGDVSLFSCLKGGNCAALVEETLGQLIKMQTVPQSEWESAVAFAPFGRRLVMWDLNYFKYEFVKSAGMAFDEDLLEDDFEKLCGRLVSGNRDAWGFMMRDCQSRNVMIHGEPYFIDYQGGRFGPCVYDAVSFLWQAKAGFSSDFRRRMFELYAREFASVKGIDAGSILDEAGIFALFRTLQVLGAYGFRGLVQKRAHFIESIPGALANLQELIAAGVADDYPELKRICKNLCGQKRFMHETDGRLHIKVFSFSYKKDYPEDLSGNGGGFMFDCRGMHNPGRYDEYKPLTGRDEPVIEFLKDKGEADVFAAKALDMVSPSVDRYLKRGFSSLQIGFGCTGGRHRSVYCAESVAHALASRYPEAVVELIHREQNIKETYNI